MSERFNRIIIGFSLLAFLFLEWHYAVWAIIALLVFEGLTNLRIPSIVTKLRYATDGSAQDFESSNNCKLNFEAERMLRFSIAITLSLGLLYNEMLWFIPFFVGFNVLLAGITGLCPLILVYKKMGFR